MKEVLQAIEAFAPYDEALLITGETGTGKEVVARRVHEMSTRREGNFVAVNVTAVPTSMFEREFFGHRRGAFSGADNDCEGYAAEADGGTLFLDEIGDMAKETQAKLLRLLQDGSYTVLGNPDERRTDLRVIAATNKDLEQAVIGREVPRGPLLSAADPRDQHPAAAQAPGGCRPAARALPQPVRAADGSRPPTTSTAPASI